MARFSRHSPWLITLQERFRSIPRRWRTDHTLSPAIGDGVRSRSGRVPPNAMAEAWRSLSDDEVLRLLALGHQQALDTLYERYARLVFSLRSASRPTG